MFTSMFGRVILLTVQEVYVHRMIFIHRRREAGFLSVCTIIKQDICVTFVYHSLKEEVNRFKNDLRTEVIFTTSVS